MASKSRRRMPSEIAIRQHWCENLWRAKGFDSPAEFMEPGTCFACGMGPFVERAHILARTEGGTDDPANLHMLCGRCHKDSEMMSGDRYFRWLHERNTLDMLVSEACRVGFNFSAGADDDR